MNWKKSDKVFIYEVPAEHWWPGEITLVTDSHIEVKWHRDKDLGDESGPWDRRTATRRNYERWNDTQWTKLYYEPHKPKHNFKHRLKRR